MGRCPWLCLNLLLFSVISLGNVTPAIALPIVTRGLRLRINVQSLGELRDRQSIRQRWDYTCGAAALATILRYQYGEDISEQKIVTTLLANGGPERRAQYQKLGFSLLDLKEFAATLGYRGVGYGGLTLEDLQKKRVPAIIPVKLAGFYHFVVFRDFDGDRVLIADPAWGNHSLTRTEFQQAWQGNIGFIILPIGDEPPQNQLKAAPEDWRYPPSRSLLNHFNNPPIRPTPLKLPE